MAEFDFPNSPIIGDEYTLNGASFRWNGEIWERFSSATIIGPQGIQGLQGSQGLQGRDGEAANQGSQGTLSNFQGLQGRQGRQGLQGLQGLQGPISDFQGTQGAQGVQNAQGRQGTQGLQGPVSDFQGTQGAQGVQNAQGNQGAQGLQGFQGIQGNQGLGGLFAGQGAQGIQGLSNQGLQGAQGLQGYQGAQGTTNQGIQGLSGTTDIEIGQTSRGSCTEPISSSYNSNTRVLNINIGTNSNAHGVKYVSSSGPASPCEGDIWYNPASFTVNAPATLLGAFPVYTTTAAYTLTTNEIGHLVSSSYDITVPLSVFSPGDSLMIYNSSLSNDIDIIEPNQSVVIYLTGSLIQGNRILGPNGLGSLLCVANNKFLFSGSGVS